MTESAKEMSSSKIGLSKRIAFWAVTALLFVGLLEVVSAAFLFRYYSALERPFFPRAAASVYMLKKAIGIPVFRPSVTVEPRPLYIVDSLLGYTTRRGTYKIGFQVHNKSYSFNFSAPRDGVRLTHYGKPRPEDAPIIYVLGDSYLLGWGNDDQLTMAWHLQTQFSNYNVVNIAQNGYGNTHALLQYKHLEPQLRENDVVIVGYGDYYLVRNYGAPSWIRTLSRGIEHRLADTDNFDVKYPVLRIKNGSRYDIEYIALPCRNNAKYCDGADPDRSTMVEASKLAFDVFARGNKKIIVAFLSGQDDDPLVDYAKEVGLPVADIRLNMQSSEWNDFYPFDGHPGPIAQYHYFRKLAASLIEHGFIRSDEQ